MYAPIPSVIPSVGEEGDFIAQSANKDYKGLPARSHRKIQTRCHLRGNFPYRGEKCAMKKGTEPLADATARLLGMRGPAPRPHGSSGMLSSQAFFWRLLHRRPCGGSSWRTAPSAPSPREQPCRRGGRCEKRPPDLAPAPWSGVSTPFRLGDIAGAGRHGPNALLLIPLDLRDGAHTHSGLPLPLASILLAPNA